MPPEPSYTTWDGTPAIFAEDKNLMRVRMGRVLHPDAWSQRPLWGTNHVVSNVDLEKESPNGDVIVRSRFHMMELRRDDVRHFAGSYSHQLERQRRLPHQAAARRHDQRAGGLRLRSPGVGLAFSRAGRA
jgi:3-phenylpropionate/cinnamic acid dioxygenase small subunit